MRALFALDGRSLAALRIAVALLVLLELGLRARDLEAHYTDAGVAPRAAIVEPPAGLAWSLHALGGSTALQAGLFVASAACALALALGWRTFPATVALWVLTTSLHGRNPFLRDGQDDLLRLLLFWGLFLPWGMRWSVDRARGRRSHPLEPDASSPGGAGGGAVASPGTIGFILQLCLVYWAAGASKIASAWWMSGDALSYVLNIARYETTLGQWLLGYPRLLGALSWATIAIELGGPLLLFVPARRPFPRIAAFVLFIGLHAGFGLCMRLGTFPWVGAAAWLALLPAPVWDRAEALVRRLRPAGAAPPSTPVPASGPPAPVPTWMRTIVPPVAAALAAGSILGAALFNLQNLRPRAPVPSWVTTLCVAVGLDQVWGVFAPAQIMPIVQRDGWFVVPGTLESGERIDLLSGAPLTLARPGNVADTFGNARWRHYFANVMMYDSPPRSGWWIAVHHSRDAYAGLLCRRWNATAAPGRRLVSVAVIHMADEMRLDETGRAARGPVWERVVLDRKCGP